MFPLRDFMASSTSDLSCRHSRYSHYTGASTPDCLHTSRHFDSNKKIEEHCVTKISTGLQCLLRFADSVGYSTEGAASTQKREEHRESLIPKDPLTRPLTRNVYVLQRECAFTKTCQLMTPAFSSCYILSGYDSRTQYRFMAHIDDGTTIESIRSIFKILDKSGVKKRIYLFLLQADGRYWILTFGENLFSTS